MAVQKLETGKIIIADPYLQDGEFTRSVVLLSNYSRSGAVGFILNRPTSILIHEAFNDFPDFNSRIYYGGPVDNNILYYVHTVGDLIPDSEPITNNLYFGGNFKTVKTLIQNNELKVGQIRFFLGYSGWTKNQLENEIKDEAWIIGSYKKSYVFHKNYSNVWGSSLEDNSQKNAFYSKFPYTPSLN